MARKVSERTTVVIADVGSLTPETKAEIKRLGWVLVEKEHGTAVTVGRV